MCQIDHNNSNGNVTMVCATSGKPITISNQYGMFCADNCDLAAISKLGEAQLKAMIAGLTDILGGPK